MAFTSYKEIRPWSRAILAAVQTRTMPPWHADPHYGKFRNDSRLKRRGSGSDRCLGQGRCAGRGSEADASTAVVFRRLANRPDAIFSIPESTLGSSGQDEQQTFFVDTNFLEDVWVDAVEIRPGNRKVVHHAHVWIANPTPAAPRETGPKRVSYTYRQGTRVMTKADAPVIDDGCSHPDGGRWPGVVTSELGAMLSSFVPGKAPETWPAGIAKRIPAGARLKFTIHYSKSANQEEKDTTSVGLRFAKVPVRQELRRIDLHNTAFRIPAQAQNHVVTACYTFNEDADVLSYLAHKHYRGRSMKFEAINPDGSTAILLNIPRYDFEWQIKYLNATPVRIPKGARIRLTATFDNSANNRYNLDPSQVIRWGDNTIDEMMDGWFEFVTPLAN